MYTYFLTLPKLENFWFFLTSHASFPHAITAMQAKYLFINNSQLFPQLYGLIQMYKFCL